MSDYAQEYVTQKEFARRARVTTSNLYKDYREGKVDRHILTKKYDVNSVINKIYIEKKQRGMRTDGTIIYSPETKVEAVELKLRKLAAEAAKIELLVAEKKGLLVSREFIETFLGAILKEHHKRLLIEMPQGVVDEIIACVLNDPSKARVAIIGLITQNVEKILKNTTKKMDRQMKNCIKNAVILDEER